MQTERLFADTNVFLRYLTNDVPPQADAVGELLQRASDGEIIDPPRHNPKPALTRST